MFDNICTLPLTSDIFCQSLHPKEPLLAVGLSSGHVETFRLPLTSSTSAAACVTENGFGKIDTSWRTRRHKGSCRTLCYSTDGESLFSAGTDCILKTCNASTGRVTQKLRIPPTGSSPPSRRDAPTLLHALSPSTLLVATDSSALHLYDLLSPGATRCPQQTFYPHDDYISSLVPLPPTTESMSCLSKCWISTGGCTVAVTDLRKGVVSRSEDQEEELLSSSWTGGGRNGKGQAAVGSAGGVVTLWARGEWEDQGERVIVSTGRGGGESVDCLTWLGDEEGTIVAGLGDGALKIVKVGKRNKGVIHEMSHDEVESVVGLGMDVGGRVISGGGKIVKVWCEAVCGNGEDEDGLPGDLKRRPKCDEEGDKDECSEEITQERQKKKRSKRGNGVEKAVLGFEDLD